MATDQLQTRFYNKKVIPFDGFRANFMDYLAGLAEDTQKNAWRTDGVYDTAVTVAQGGGNNNISIAAAAGFTATDGLGKFIEMASADSRLQDVEIPPDAGVVYTVGLEQSRVEAGIEINPRTGESEYINYQELVGRVGTPDSVVDNGNGTLTAVVNAITESGKDYSGREIRIWLKARDQSGPGPLATTEGDAIETIAIQYVVTDNKITTTGDLGQGTISTTASDYVIMLVGPTVRRKALEDLRNTSGVFFLADVTSVAVGNPIPGGNIDTDDQRVFAFSLSDYDEVLWRDAHGSVKVRVTADALDSDVPQVSVRDSSANERWSVDEDGEVRFTNLSGRVVRHYVGSVRQIYAEVDDTSYDWTYNIRNVGGGSVALLNDELQSGAFNALQSGVISGLAITDGGGLDAALASGVAWINTRRRPKDADTIALADNDTNFVYLNSTGVLSTTTTVATAFDRPNLPLAIVTTAAGGITGITDVRRWFKPRQGKWFVTAGPDGEFVDIPTALAWLQRVREADQSDWPEVEIVVQGEHTYSNTIDVGFPVTIRGAGGSLITWDFNGALFDLTVADSSGSRFLDIQANFDFVGAAASSRFIKGGSRSDVVVEGCVIASTLANRNLAVGIEVDLGANNWEIIGNRILDVAITGIMCGATGDATQCRIQNNLITLGTTAIATSYGIGINGDRHLVSGNLIEGFNIGIYVGNASSTSYCLVQGNYLKGTGNYGMLIEGPTTSVIGNHLYNSTEEATALGAIYFGASADECVCNGNVVQEWTNDWAIYCAGDRPSIIGNHCKSADATLDGGIKCTAANAAHIEGNAIHFNAAGCAGVIGIDASATQRSNVSNNTIHHVGTAGTTGTGIDVDEASCVVGNKIYNTNGTGIRIRDKNCAVTGNMIAVLDNGEGFLFDAAASDCAVAGNVITGLAGAGNSMNFTGGCTNNIVQTNSIDNAFVGGGAAVQMDIPPGAGPGTNNRVH